MDIEKSNQCKSVSLYAMSGILTATFFGGPLAGCYLMSKNFENLGRKDLAQKTIKIGIISNLLIFGVIPFIPESIIDKVPRSVIPTIFVAIIYYYVNLFQKKNIDEHIRAGGKKYSFWKAFGIAIVSGVITVICLFLWILLKVIIFGK